MTLKEEFQESCKSLKPDEVVERYLIERTSFFFEHIQEGKEYEFKKNIARLLKVHIRDIVIVGSGKLGFSMKPDSSHLGFYPFISFDGREGKKSDLDIAIISSTLFDREMQNLYDYTNFANYKWKKDGDFNFFIFKGRLTVRNLPPEFLFSREIRDVQEKYRTEYGREVNLEIYKSWHYFETYHQQNVISIQVNLIASI